MNYSLICILVYFFGNNIFLHPSNLELFFSFGMEKKSSEYFSYILSFFFFEGFLLLFVDICVHAEK